MLGVMISPPQNIFYYNVQDCYERGLDRSECVDDLIKIKEEVNEVLK